MGVQPDALLGQSEGSRLPPGLCSKGQLSLEGEHEQLLSPKTCSREELQRGPTIHPSLDTKTLFFVFKMVVLVYVDIAQVTQVQDMCLRNRGDGSLKLQSF